MTEFRKKPVVIEAEQFWPEKKPWPEGVYRVGGSLPNDKPDLWWRLRTLEGVMHVTPGDWIITGVKGERYPCKPDIFEATYEPVEGGAMTEHEIERCVCGGKARLWSYGESVDGWVECKQCDRKGPQLPKECAIASWNHDQRGLRLLREVADAWSQCFYPSPYLVNKVFAWAKEGDRE